MTNTTIAYIYTQIHTVNQTSDNLVKATELPFRPAHGRLDEHGIETEEEGKENKEQGRREIT